MAIYHFTAKMISRSNGRSSVASAAYRRADNLYDERQEKYQDYTNKPDVIHSEIIIPDNAPEWIKEIAKLQQTDKTKAAEKLWNIIETHEKRKDAQLAREVEFALPVELNQEQCIKLVCEFVHDQFVIRGMVADYSVHWDEGNPHAHVMLSTRQLTEEGFGKKIREWNDKNLIVEWRRQWAEYTNLHLQLNHHQARIDHRSYKDQGINLTPGIHQGKAATDMERRGIRTDLIREANQIRQENLQKISKNPEILLDKIATKNSSFTEQTLVNELGCYINDKGLFNTHSGENESTAFSQAKALIRDQVLKNLNKEEAQHPAKVPLTSETVLAILNQIEHHESVFTERELAKALAPYTQYAEDFAKAFVQLKASSQLVYLGVGEDGRDRYTTQKMFALENRIQDIADLLRESKHLQINKRTVERILTEYQQRIGKNLTDEQLTAVKHLLKNTSIACVVGRAGTGKSFALGAAKEVWEQQGLSVYGIALSGIAADGLRKDAGIDSYTIESFRLAVQSGQLKLNKKDVIVMDEAGMTDSVSMLAVLEAVGESGAKLALIGDHGQLQPVGAGAVFRALLERLGFAEIQKIFRQKEAWQREATVALSTGQVGKALDAYQQHGCIVLAEDAEQAASHLINDWQQMRVEQQKPLKEFLIIAHSNEEINQLNLMARQQRLTANEIRQGYTVNTEQGAIQISVGDRILFLKNNKKLGVSNGRFATIQNLQLNEIGHIVNIIVQLDSQEEKPINFSPENYRHFTYGYAATVHKIQGLTVDHAFVLAKQGWNRLLTYVAKSRHRLTSKLYSDKQNYKDFEALKKGLGRFSIKDSVLDFPLSFSQRRGFDTEPLLKRLQIHLSKKLQLAKQSLTSHYEEILYPTRYWARKEADAINKQQIADTYQRREEARLVAAYVDANREYYQAREVVNTYIAQLGIARDDYKAQDELNVKNAEPYKIMQLALSKRDALAAQIYAQHGRYTQALDIYGIELARLSNQANAHNCRERIKTYLQESKLGRTVVRDKLAAEIADNIKQHYSMIRIAGLNTNIILNQAKAHERRLLLTKLPLEARQDFYTVEQYRYYSQKAARSWELISKAQQKGEAVSNALVKQAEAFKTQRDSLAHKINSDFNRYMPALEFYQIGSVKPQPGFEKPTEKAINNAQARLERLKQYALRHTVNQRIQAYNTALLAGNQSQREYLAHLIKADAKIHHRAIMAHSLTPAATWGAIRQDAKTYERNQLLATLTNEQQTNFAIVEAYRAERKAASEAWKEIFATKENESLSPENIDNYLTPIAKTHSIQRDRLAAKIYENPEFYQQGLEYYKIDINSLNEATNTHYCRERVKVYQQLLIDKETKQHNILARAELAHTITENPKAHHSAVLDNNLNWKVIYQDAKIIERKALFNSLFPEEKHNLRLIERYQKLNRQAGKAWSVAIAAEKEKHPLAVKKQIVANALSKKRDRLASMIAAYPERFEDLSKTKKIDFDKLLQQAKRYYAINAELQKPAIKQASYKPDSKQINKVSDDESRGGEGTRALTPNIDNALKQYAHSVIEYKALAKEAIKRAATGQASTEANNRALDQAKTTMEKRAAELVANPVMWQELKSKYGHLLKAVSVGKSYDSGQASQAILEGKASQQEVATIIKDMAVQAHNYAQNLQRSRDRGRSK